jgi:hypothetical protein
MRRGYLGDQEGLLHQQRRQPQRISRPIQALDRAGQAERWQIRRRHAQQVLRSERAAIDQREPQALLPGVSAEHRTRM